MFWVMQKNLYAEEAFASLVDQLERQNIDFQIVNMIPFAHEMEPDVNPTGNVIVMGSTSMKWVALKKKWFPGYIDDNINYNNLIDNYDNNVFNLDCVIIKFGDLPLTSKLPQWSSIFVRPVDDGKSFAGHVTTWQELYAWWHMLEDIGWGNTSRDSIRKDSYIVISEAKEIHSEYRFFVVNGKVVTGSQYKIGNRVHYSNVVDQEVYDFAQRMANDWSPNRGYALDICRANDRFYVLEINALNSAGFYACDMGKLIHALEVEFS